MAAGVLSDPGTKFGPCEHACHHSDCAETRRMAASECRICHHAIGYGRRFYHDYVVGTNPRTRLYVHAACREDEVVAQQKAEREAHAAAQQSDVGLASVFASHARGE